MAELDGQIDVTGGGSNGSDTGAPEDRRSAMERAFDDLDKSSGEGSGTASHGSEAKKHAGADNDSAPVVSPEKLAGNKPADKRAGSKTADPAAVAPVRKFKAPGGWKPGVRQHWDALPPEVQEEIVRREADADRMHNQSLSHRKHFEEFAGIVRPYEGLMRASGVTPLQAIGNLVQTAARLQVGTPQEKVQVVAAIIKSYGIDLPMLDALLSGQQVPPAARANDELMRAIDQRLKPMNDFMAYAQNSRQQNEIALARETATEAQNFAADPANDHFEDLRYDIADILEMAANRGREMTLKQAYDLAASQHPEISKIIAKRQSDEKTRQAAQTLARSRRAASSQPAGVPGGVGGRGGKPANRRDAISQAWDDLST